MSNQPLETIYVDLTFPDGYLKENRKVVSGKQSILTTIDEYSRASWKIGIPQKHRTSTILLNWIEMTEKQFRYRNYKVHTIVCDNGKESTHLTKQQELRRYRVVNPSPY